jgi:hypothetical protein
VGGDVRRRLPVTTWGRLTTSLGWAKHACLVAGGALGGDATWLRERVPEEVAMFALSQDLRAALPVEPGANRADPVAIAGPGMRNQ